MDKDNQRNFQINIPFIRGTCELFYLVANSIGGPTN